MKPVWIVVFTSFLAGSASAQINLAYYFGDAGVTITGYSGFAPLESFAIPASIDNVPVTSISSFALENLESVTNVTIPAGVTNIGDAVFYGCENLAAIIVDPANSIYSSTNGVLFDKSQDTLLEYPGGLGGTYSIPESVTEIGDLAFARCEMLDGVVFPPGVELIDNEAFSDCAALKNISIPAGVTNIGTGPFSGCAALTNIAVDAANPAYAGVSGVLFDKEELTLVQFPSGRAGAYSIPSTVKSLAVNSFLACANLTAVTIPAALTNLGTDPFLDCSKLGSFTVDSGNPDFTAVSGVLFSKDKTALVEYPAGLSGAYTVADGTKEIAAGAFQDCSGLTKVTLPSGLTNIESSAFQNCGGITSISIPGTVAEIGSGAFEDCSFITTATINTGVANIASNAFANCSELATVTLPSSLTNIAAAAFYYCLSLESLAIPGKVSSIGPQAFAYCSGLAGMTIPTSVTSLGEEAFEYCSGMSSISIPASVAEIQPYTFYECASLTSMSLPSGVAAIGLGAFDQCYSMTAITIPGTVTSIGDLAFNDCTSLAQISVPAGVANIGSTAFNECSSLTAINVSPQNTSYSSLNGVLFDKTQATLVAFPGGIGGSYTIPPGVTQIGLYAFQNCAAVTNVVIPATVTNIGGAAFDNCSGLGAITIPAGVAAIGNDAFTGSFITNFYFAGALPALGADVFDTAAPPTVYFVTDGAGWSALAKTGVNAVLWNPVIQTGTGFGVQNNQFGFVITGPTNAQVAVESCTNLSALNWTPIETVSLANGSFNFSEPLQTNLAARFYGLGLP